FTSTRSRNCPAFWRSPSWISGAEASLAGCTAIGPGLKFRHIDTYRGPALIKPAVWLLIGWCRWHSGQQSGHEGILGEELVIQAREHLIERCRQRNTVESDWFAGVSGQHKQVRRELAEPAERLEQHPCVLARLLLTRV